MILSNIRATALKGLLIAVCLVVSATGYAAVNTQEELTASKVFAEIPIEVLDMLRPSTRLDMLDYYSHADSLVMATDALGGKSQLQQVAPDYLKLSVTPVSTLEIKILPSKKGSVVMTLYTVSDISSQPSGASDTRVQFFDSNLKPLDSKKFLKAPSLKDFFNLKDSGIKESDLTEKIPFDAIAYTTGPGSAPLTATFTTLSTLSQEDRDLLTPLLIPTLTADWNQSYKFK